jgi:hypothetical protein
MRSLRYSINVTLDGCCDHRVMIADEDLHRHAVENLARADALLFGRVTYELMEAGWRRPAPAGRGLTGWNPSPGRSTRQRSTSCRAPWIGRLERGARARGSGEGRAAAQAGVG